MDKTNLIIQNRLREATVSLERASLLHCDENWKCEYSVPPFSSIGLVLEGEEQEDCGDFRKCRGGSPYFD